MSPRSSLEALISTVCAAPRETLRFDDAPPDVSCHLRSLHAVNERFTTPIDRAFAGGFGSDRIGTAFAAGYTEALRALVAEPAFVLSAFAVTEPGGGAPRAMQTTLTWQPDGTARLHGEKTFVTLGRAAERIYVVASEGKDPSGQNQLRVARLSSAVPGLAWSPGPSLPIVPEIAHARLTLEAASVRAEDVLPGDGYLAYVKPFRTVEDLHVHAALLGHLLRVVRAFALPSNLASDLIGTFATFRALALEPPLDATTHLALGGALAAFERMLAAHDAALHGVPEPVRMRFDRDMPLRFLAGKAREKRLDAATVVLGLGR